jgi:hypothetical protein
MARQARRPAWKPDDWGSCYRRAVERELIPRNPAKGRERRVRERKPVRNYLENACQIRALLDAAGELDAAATRERRHMQKSGRRYPP